MNFPESIAELTMIASRETVEAYAALTFDYNPLHLDEAFAAGTPFGKPIAHGTLALNLLLQAIAKSLEDHRHQAGQRLDIRFAAPVKVGDTMRTGGRRLAEGEGRYEVWVKNSADQVVLGGALTIGPVDDG